MTDTEEKPTPTKIPGRDIVLIPPQEVAKRTVTGEIIEKPVVDRERVEKLLGDIEQQRAQGFINMPFLDELLKTVGAPGITEIAKKMAEADREGDLIGRIIVDPQLWAAHSGDVGKPGKLF